LEGIVYKLFDTPYEMGKSKVWKKFKHERETIDAIVVGEEYGKLGSKFEHEKVVFRLGVIGSGGSIVELCSVLVGSVDIAKTITLNSVIEIKYYQI
jgi:ATP-dependent DNA ligase